MIAKTFAVYMKLIYRSLFLILVVAFIGKSTFAQEIPDVPSQIEDINPEDLKGADPSELQRILDDANRNKKNAGEDVNLRPEDEAGQDTLQKDEFKDSVRKMQSPKNLYGADIFRGGEVMQLSQLSTPPDDYIIGVGDHIVVSLWGGADFEQDYVVARDGSIFPRGLGKITVQGLTFKNARAVLFNRFSHVIPDGTNISVTMGQPRSIVVQVTGNVANPGPVVISAFTNMLNVVALAGGINDFGNLRNIQLSRNGKVIDSIDIYKYLSSGNFGKHVYLENNDFVIVPFYDKKVLATGQFKRPMYYQLKEGEGIKDLIKYSGGFTSDAYTSGVSIIRSINEKQLIKTVNIGNRKAQLDNSNDEPLYDGDVVAVNAINQGLVNKVLVKGEVAYPGIYEVKEGDKLFDVINKAGGLTPRSYLERAFVYKNDDDPEAVNTAKIDVDLNDFNKDVNSVNNVTVGPNDIIEILSRSQFEEKQTVTIMGEVRSPGKYPRYLNMSLKDLLYFARGLKPSAEFGNITITSVLDADSSGNHYTPASITERTFAIHEDLTLDSTLENVLLKPFDQVIVRKNPNYQLQQNVKINGQVLYPGTYPKLSPDERLSSLVKRSGGILENGNLHGALLYRTADSASNKAIIYTAADSTDTTNLDLALKHDVFKIDSAGRVILPNLPKGVTLVSIDLEKALKNPGGKFDLALVKGDVLYIPSINNTVTVSGAVQNALKLTYDSKERKVKYYIDKAGGFGVRPWRKRIFVTYPDGTSRGTKTFLFFRKYPDVVSGSVITIPQKSESRMVGDIINRTLISTIPLIIVYLITRRGR